MNTAQNISAGQFFDVFSLRELQLITSALEKLSDAPNQGALFKAYTNGFSADDLIYPFIKKTVLEKAQLVLGKELKLTVGMHLKEQFPWTIHTDYVKNDRTPDLAILIPLTAQVLNTHTVVFNELCLDHFDKFIVSHDKIINNASNLWQSLMSHETADRLEYVSLRGMYQWVPGSMIYWDRRLLHSSDNFINVGIQQKQALVLFTNQD